jgi:hypothetical protein
MSAFDNLFAAFEDQRLPGGCDECGAHWTIDPFVPGVHILVVHHKEGCRVLRAAEAEMN